MLYVRRVRRSSSCVENFILDNAVQIRQWEFLEIHTVLIVKCPFLKVFPLFQLLRPQYSFSKIELAGIHVLVIIPKRRSCNLLCLELLSVEHHKTKTRLVALISHYGPRQPSGTNQNSKKMYVTKTKHECVMIA